MALGGSYQRSPEAWFAGCTTATACVCADGTFLWSVDDEVIGAAVAAGPDVHCWAGVGMSRLGSD